MNQFAKKFDGTHSKFWSFVNQVRLIIQFHQHCYLDDRTQVGFIGTLLSCTSLTWFAHFLECQFPLLNDFEAFLEKFGVFFWHFRQKMYNNKQVVNFSLRITSNFCVHFWIHATNMWNFMGQCCALNQFQFKLYGDVKDLLLPMLDPMTLSQIITQIVCCDNWLCECVHDKCWESSPTLKQFMPPMLQPKHMVFAPNDNPMWINKTWFKPLTKQEKQCQHANNLCLYCGKSSHIINACPNKRVQHVARTTTSITTQGPKEKGNKDV